MTHTESATSHEVSRDQALLATFRQHIEIEGAALESYRDLVERASTDDAITYLIRMILEDEERHHRIFEEMANEIRSFVWELPVEPRAPSIVSSSDPELLEATRHLLALEKADRKQLRALRKRLRGGAKRSLQPVLVEVMLRDTQKHIAILEAIVANLKR